MPIASDPAYLAYLRAIGQQEQAARDDAAGGIAEAQRRTALYRPELEFQGGVERENISGSYESRGLYGSGARQESLARQQHAQQFGISQLLAEQANSTGSLNRALAAKLADFSRQRAEAAFEAQARDAQQQAIAGATGGGGYSGGYTGGGYTSAGSAPLPSAAPIPSRPVPPVRRPLPASTRPAGGATARPSRTDSRRGRSD